MPRGTRLIIVGVPVTWAFGAVFGRLLLGLPTGTAVMLGAILVVSGPTVVGPLLAFIRPTERLQRILSWEGSLIDAVGGILGAVVYATVLAGGYQPGDFLLSVAVGAATVTPESLHHLVLPTLGLVAVLVLVARPLVAFLATIRSDLTI